MGNQTVRPSDIQSVDTYLFEIKHFIQYKASLGSTTFMKTARVVLIDNNSDSYNIDIRYGLPSNSSGTSSLNQTLNDSNQSSQNTLKPNQQQNNLKQKFLQLKEQQQQVVVKIFPKYDLSVRLDLYAKQVREIKNTIMSRYGTTTNCIPFNELLISERAAYLFRQYVRYNLYDRLSTRPFLTHIEKKWIAFQLLCAVNEIHSLQIVHGDIKTENVMVNSFLWISLTDFASYKPVYLSKDHPVADFNYYFDISRRRTCYLAPERLDPNKDSTANKPNTDLDTGLTEIAPPDPNDFKTEMDIFSLGCVIAELFTERPLFSFAQLLSYRDNRYDPKLDLESEIGDKSILEMILSMISLRASERKTANEYLQEQNDKSFPSYFVYLKNYISRFINVKLTGDECVIKLKNDLPVLLKNFKLNLNEVNDMDKNDNRNSESSEENQENSNDAFLILLHVLLSCVRKIKFAENKLIAVDLMQNFSKFLHDSIILDRVLPYYLYLLDDVSPIVKFHVVFALNDCLSSIYKIDVRNLNIFPELIFDILEKLSKDESFLVRCAVAKTISNFALTSLRFLDTSFITRRSFLNTSLNPDEQDSNFKYETYDKEYESYQTMVKDIVLSLLTDHGQNSQTTNAVREILISSDISKLCSFFQRQKTSEVLLAHMITVLNEKTDWSVRAAFFDSLCPVLSCIGWESVEIFKSLIEQGLRDSEEFVIYRTLISLAKMVEVGLLDKQQIYYFLSQHIAPLLCHPSLWLRHGSINFITTVCRQNSKNSILNTADILCTISPILSKFLTRKDLLTYDKADILFQYLKPCLKRAVYDCISQDGRADKLFNYLSQRREIRNYLPRYIDCNDQDVQKFFDKLCILGFVEEDEEKLLEMKDFIDKTKMSRLSSSVHNADLTTSNSSSGYNQTWLNLRDNFYSKDGCIYVLRDKFNKFNTEFLVSRSLAQDSKFFDFSGSNNQSFNSSLPPPETETTYNAEWKLMFGNEETKNIRHKNSFKNSAQSDIASPTTTVPARRRISSLNFSSPPNQPLQKRQHDCTLEVDKFLDRSKFMYEEQKLKKNKIEKFRDSINSSVNSNLISLAKTIGKWKPKGYLVLNSNEHTKEINKITRNYDSNFFVTCSTSEQCVKLWSTENLLESRTGLYKSIFTYDKQNSQDGNFRPICSAFYNKNSLAILSEDFKFYCIDFNEKRTQCRIYSNEKLFRSNSCKFNSINQHYDKINFYYLNKHYQKIPFKCSPKSCYCSGNYPIEMINIDDTNPSWPLSVSNPHDYFNGTKSSPTKGLFCYSSSTGAFSCIDMRCKIKAFDVKRDLKKGFITSMITDPWYTWIAMGTSNGNIELYDFRFMVPFQTFEHRSKTSVAKMCNHPISNSKIIASYQVNNELCVWNMDARSGSLGKSINSQNKLEPEFVFWGVQSVPPLCQNKFNSSYISGLMGCTAGDETGTNGIICASTDMKIRYLDLTDPNRDSYIISSAFNFQQNKNSSDSSTVKNEFASSVLSPSVTYETRQIEGNRVLLELDQNYSNDPNGNPPVPLASAALTFQSCFTNHQDAISDLTVCYNPLANKNQPLIITTARDGTLKIWR
uniref:non-specific serine/threonine protein kinase n=1 Tax=Brachionus calyciflorus TaxID=104777 RepID=A0A2Z4EUP4_9BILA|nr:phosphoinositide 3-kinase regulatory subunit 4 [Brachionus calyciflorus]